MTREQAVNMSDYLLKLVEGNCLNVELALVKAVEKKEMLVVVHLKKAFDELEEACCLLEKK